MTPQHPEWRDLQPFKAVLEGDVAGVMAVGMDGLVALVMATHAGTSTEAFADLTRDWIASARHPEFKRPYTDLVYKPMLEVLPLLTGSAFTPSPPSA